jgi:exosortase N
VTYLLILLLITYAGWRGPWLWRLAALALASPLLLYLSAIFGFAIRLHLSAWAGTLLRAAGFAVTTEGNLLIMNGQAMSVDPACMGVQMIGFTLLVAVFWVIQAEKRQQRQLPLAWVLAYAGVAFGLVLVSNLFRIVVLVGFGIGPGRVAHEVVGLACVVGYAWLPLGGLAGWVVRHMGQPIRIQPARPLRWAVRWAKLALGSLFLVAFTRPTEHLFMPRDRVGYVRQATAFGFTQYSRPGELIYIKPLPNWYSAEHTPAICWRGQGYILRRIREATIAGQAVYVADLQKGNRRLHTAWWFSNGTYRSISQVDMRSRMLVGEPGFALVNVTTTDADKLAGIVQTWL